MSSVAASGLFTSSLPPVVSWMWRAGASQGSWSTSMLSVLSVVGILMMGLMSIVLTSVCPHTFWNSWRLLWFLPPHLGLHLLASNCGEIPQDSQRKEDYKIMVFVCHSFPRMIFTNHQKSFKESYNSSGSFMEHQVLIQIIQRMLNNISNQLMLWLTRVMPSSS